MCLHIRTQILVCSSVYVYMHGCVFIDIFMRTFLYIYIYMCVCVCECIYIFMLVYVYAYMFVYIYIYIYVRIGVCIHAFISTYICMDLCARIRIYIYIYIYIYICVCVCIILSVYICMYTYVRFSLVRFGLGLWHIKHCWSFNAKSCFDTFLKGGDLTVQQRHIRCILHHSRLGLCVSVWIYIYIYMTFEKGITSLSLKQWVKQYHNCSTRMALALDYPWGIICH